MEGEAITRLLRVQELLGGKEFDAFPQIAGDVQTLRGKVDAELTREIPSHIAALEKQHGWRGKVEKQLPAFDRFGMFAGEGKKGDRMSPRELRNHAPGAGDLIEALKDRPALLRKIEQGDTEVQLVPFGLSPEALSKLLGKAVLEYHGLGKLRSTDGTKLAVDESEPVWLWNEYPGADVSEKLVYFPERFAPEDHGGKTKKDIIESQKFPGWQMLLTENLSDIPRQGKGKTVGGRPQIEANRTPNEYLALLQSQAYDLESGATPESWQARAITHLAETEGEFLDDYQSGSACYLPGAWFPSSGVVGCAYWGRARRRAGVGRFVPGCRGPVAGARFEVGVH